MKTNIKVFTSTGELTTLGRELGKGGEGAVYDIEEFVDSVAKIYHTPPPPLKQDKLAFQDDLATPTNKNGLSPSCPPRRHHI